MTRLWIEGERIHMECDSDGRPVRFIWRGRAYRLQRIQQRWQVDSDWWSPDGRIWRDYLALLTFDGLFCVLYYDHLDAQWHMGKVYD